LGCSLSLLEITPGNGHVSHEEGIGIVNTIVAKLIELGPDPEDGYMAQGLLLDINFCLDIRAEANFVLLAEIGMAENNFML